MRHNASKTKVTKFFKVLVILFENKKGNTKSADPTLTNVAEEISTPIKNNFCLFSFLEIRI